MQMSVYISGKEVKNDLNNANCVKCKEDFVFDPEDIFFDERGTGYSTKLVKCPYCGSINIIKYYVDKSLDVNNDARYYNYKRI